MDDTFLVQPECADVDDHLGVTMRDLNHLINWVFLRPAILDCQLDNGTYPPMPNSEAFLHFNSLIPPDDSLIRVYLDATMPQTTRGLGIVMRILVDGEAPEFGDINVDVSDGYGWTVTDLGDERTAYVPPGYIIGGYVDYQYPGITSGRYPLGEVELIVNPSSSYRTITIELTEWPPGDNTPMLVKEYPFDALELNLSPWVVDQTGDANNDRILSAGDIIELVNFVFKSGPTPYPVPATGDVNCSGTVTSADLIGLVNYVFKSGAAPCDVEAECTINLDQWTCP